MKERPILFSGEMVRAILDGRKTQTRRVIKPQPVQGPYEGQLHDKNDEMLSKERFAELWCPLGKPGDRLWVRETFQVWDGGTYEYPNDQDLVDGPLGDTPFGQVVYRADTGHSYDRWRPSIHMPRWASRITLEITNVRVERMQEGGDREFWGETKWNENPWVWVIEFKKPEGNDE